MSIDSTKILIKLSHQLSLINLAAFSDRINQIIITAASKDKEFLLEAHPVLKNEIDALPPKYIVWLSMRYGENPTQQEVHPIEDAIPTLQNYKNKESGLNSKYQNSEDFKTIVDQNFPDKKWNSPADIMTISIDEMEEIMLLSQRKKLRVEVKSDESYKKDFIAKVGPWNIWLPSSRENSIQIAGYNKTTLKPDTTWCTARISESNLFYSYVTANLILYYVIKDNPSSDSDWISIGVEDGQIASESRFGGVTVDRANNGLTIRNLKDIFGGSFEQIINIVESKAEELGGESPAYSKIKGLFDSIESFDQLTQGNSSNEKQEMLALALRNLGTEKITKELVSHMYDVGVFKNFTSESSFKIINRKLSEARNEDFIEYLFEYSKKGLSEEEYLRTIFQKSEFLAVSLAAEFTIYEHENYRNIEMIFENATDLNPEIIKLISAGNPHIRDILLKPALSKKFNELPMRGKKTLFDHMANEIAFASTSIIRLSDFTDFIKMEKKIGGPDISNRELNNIARFDIPDTDHLSLLNRAANDIINTLRYSLKILDNADPDYNFEDVINLIDEDEREIHTEFISKMKNIRNYFFFKDSPSFAESILNLIFKLAKKIRERLDKIFKKYDLNPSMAEEISFNPESMEILYHNISKQINREIQQRESDQIKKIIIEDLVIIGDFMQSLEKLKNHTDKYNEYIAKEKSKTASARNHRMKRYQQILKSI